MTADSAVRREGIAAPQAPSLVKGAGHSARRYDAVVIGAGATGGMAALSLAEAGLNVLVLDAGPRVGPLAACWRRVRHRARQRLLGPERALTRLRTRQMVQANCYAWPGTPDAFIDDIDHPYTTSAGHAFVWIRSRQLGGRMVVPGHGRQNYRLGPWDLAPVDGLSPPWPLTYEELEPWYTLAEQRLPMVGAREGLRWLPDSLLARTIEPAPSEAAAIEAIARRWPGYPVVLGRYSAPFDFIGQAGRTGRLTIRQGAVVSRVLAGADGRVRGVEWVDARSGCIERLEAPIVFLCASALESTRILLHSRSADGREGLGARSGALGRYLMDHVRLTLEGWAHPAGDLPVEPGRCLYLPRFDARAAPPPGPARGFGVQLFTGQIPGQKRIYVVASAFGEMLPDPENQVRLDPTLRDRWGIPALHIRCAHGPRELATGAAQRVALHELAEVLGLEVIRQDEAPLAPGTAIHECGTARMGHDPATSVLDPYNECWEARGLFVTDGSCLPSQGTQNPTLTYMALTARACARALEG